MLFWNLQQDRPASRVVVLPGLALVARLMAATTLVACGTSQRSADGDADGGMTGCAEDERVAAGACVPCEPGTSNAPGDDPGGPDTDCAPILCGENERVFANTCLPCDPGLTNEAGDDATGPTTFCAPGGCAVDERVEAQTCVPCDPGTRNDAGDSTTGGDTSCQPIRCAEDERVEDHACVPCPDGLVSPPGADASGNDTTCGTDDCFAALGVDCETFREAYIKGPSPGSNDRFGSAVAIDGGTLVVAARLEDSAASGVDGDASDESANASGAVFVFERQDTVWLQTAYLKASNPDATDFFGTSVAISGDTIIVGAPRESSSASGVDGDQRNNGRTSSGAAYVFVRNAGVWTQQAYLKASNPGEEDWFGNAVAIDGDIAVVGAQYEDSSDTGIDGSRNDENAEDSGAAYVFRRRGSRWAEDAYLKASNTGRGDYFGVSVAVEGDTVVVGAPFEDSGAMGIDGDQANDAAMSAGAAYVFVQDRDGSWAQEAYLKTSNAGTRDFFGGAVAMDDGVLVITAPHEASAGTGPDADPLDDSAQFTGAAYVFERRDAAWTELAYLKASNAGEGDLFGVAVDIDGDTVVIGAPRESSLGTDVDGDDGDTIVDGGFRALVGAVYVFRRAGPDAFEQRAYLKASNPDPGDAFGIAVAISGETVAIGAAGERGSSAGVGGDEESDDFRDAGAVYIRRIGP